MKLNNKEQKIKEILDDLNFDLDTDQLWNEVNIELEQDKKKRRLWFIPFFVLGLFAAYLLMQQENHISQDQKRTAVESIQLENDKATATSILAKNQLNNNPTKTEQLFSNKTNNATPSNISKTSKKLKNETSISNTKNTRDNSKVNDKVIFTPQVNTVVTTQKNRVVNTIQKNKSIETLSNVVERNLISSISFLAPGTPTSLLSNRALNLNEALSQSLRQTFPLIKKGPGLMFTINSGILFGQSKNLKINSIGEFDPEHFNREKTMPTLSLEAGISFSTKSRIIIGGGIAYSNFVNRYNDNRNQIETTTIDGTEFIYLDSNNNPTEEGGQLNKTISTNNNIQWHRQHQQYDVYFSIAKPFLYFSKFSVMPELTLLHNVSSNHTGYYFADNSAGFHKIENGASHPYTSNTGLKAQLGLQLSYGLGKTSLGLKAIYRNNFKNLTESNHFYSIRNSQYGLQLTMTYRPTWE